MAKTTIIDGIDVSECRYFVSGYTTKDGTEIHNFCHWGFQHCKDVDKKDCCYKQLKHKEQECEELKKRLENCDKWRIHSEKCAEEYNLKYSIIKDKLTLKTKQLEVAREYFDNIKKIISDWKNADNYCYKNIKRKEKLLQNIEQALQQINETESDNVQNLH